MRKISILWLFLALGFETNTVNAQQPAPVATIQKVRVNCTASTCRDRDAIVFIHGIFGDETTFKNGEFDWPAEMPPTLENRPIDVYRINYITALHNWLRSDVATLDDVVYSVFLALYPDNRGDRPALSPPRYRSVNFVAHSLGGNVAAALLHTIKTELGHEERARFGSVITLGTPVNGAQIANAGGLAHLLLGGDDRLLKSLERDNTFLRMMSYWRRSENEKARRFDCRPVTLHAGIEGAKMYGVVEIVPRDSAEKPLRDFGLTNSFHWFDGRTHESIAKPSDAQDEVYDWVRRMLASEMRRINSWHATHPRPELCRRVW